MSSSLPDAGVPGRHPPAQPSALPAWCSPSLVLRGGAVVLSNTIVSLALFGLAQDGWSSARWFEGFVYSQCIGLSCWLLVDGGRLLILRFLPASTKGGNWPGWQWIALLCVVAAPLGYLLGLHLAAVLVGDPQTNILKRPLGSTVPMVLMSVLIGVMLSTFFYTRGKLAQAEADAEEAQRLAAESRLRLLESQLEPHMLFNTLANLRALIALDAVAAQAMLDRLIAFLRSTLSASQAAWHPLADEFARIADYLELMKVRMGDRLQASLELPPELAQWPVPPLLLQPLVENALRHGLEPSVAGGRIRIQASREGDDLVLRVQDSGVGFRPAAPSQGGYGIEHVRERLAAAYRGRASFVLAPGEGGVGTLARLRLPAAPVDS